MPQGPGSLARSAFQQAQSRHDTVHNCCTTPGAIKVAMAHAS